MERVVVCDVTGSGQEGNGEDLRARRRVVDPQGARARASNPERAPAAEDETRAHRVAPPHANETRPWPAATARAASPPTSRYAAATPDHDGTLTTAPRGRRLLTAGLIGLVALGAICAAVVVGVRSYEPKQDDTGGVLTDTWHPKYAPQKDVTLEDCKIERTGARVGGTVRNPTHDAADYIIEVHLVDASGATITAASPTATAVPANSKTTWAGVLPAVPSTAQSATCKLVKVNRYVAR